MIPFLDLPSEYRELRPAIDAAIARVIDSGQFVLGPEVSAFEEEFAAYCDTPYAIGVNSGTSALHLALLAAGIGPGDEVVTSPFSFFAPVAAIRYVGATPVLADIDSRTFNIDPARIEAALTERTRAIIPVHLYGQPADMDAVLAIARRHKLLVIEDAAQAHGAKWKGRSVGSLGDFGCFSFYPTKNLGAAGEGGMVVTRDPEHARILRALRDCGQEQKYYPTMLGYNYRLPAVQAAILRVKLTRLPAWTEARRANAAAYDHLLEQAGLTPPYALPGACHVYHLYTVRLPERDATRQRLTDKGIGTAIHYPTPIHLLPAYSDTRYRAGDFPVVEACAASVLSLPVYPSLTAGQIERVVAELQTAMR